MGLLAVALVDELVYGAADAALPLIRRDLHVGYAGVGLLLSLPLVLGSLVELPLGLLADGGRRRRLVLLGGAGFCAALAVAGAAPDFAVLLGAMVVLYPASGAFVGLSQASLMDVDPARGEHHMARWTLAGSVGAVCGPLVLAAAVGLGGGWRGAFAALAGAALLAWRAVAPAHPRSVADQGTSLVAAARAAVSAARQARVVRWLALLIVSDFLLDVLSGFLALYFVDVVGVPPARAALALAVRQGAGLAGDMALVPLLRRVRGTTVVRWGAAVSLAAYPALLVVPGFWPKLALLVVVSLASAPWYPLLTARLYEGLPGRSGAVVSLTSAAALAGGLLVALAGVAAQRVGLVPTMASFAAVPVLLLAALRPSPPGSGRPPPGDFRGPEGGE